ncbi:MAG: hypothetical protein LBN04_09510 [Oscillospiraceae bacterium]|jgi:hypothetical protein|nr:hypothetical protein [Oscillospiraceae bacterium]
MMNTTDLLALVAVVLSLVSISSTIVLGFLQHRHNKKSVRPICDIQFFDFDNDIAVFLRNVGTGPLTVKKIECSNGERSSSKLIELMPEIEGHWAQYTEDIADRTIAVGEKITLIELHPANEQDRNHVRWALAPITICVVYTDIYGEERFTQWQNSIFLARHTVGIDTIRKASRWR